MNNNTVIVIAIFALVIIIALLAFRKRVKGTIEGPLKTKLSIDASNPQPTLGATIEDAKSHGGSILAEDLTGRGASVRRAEAQQDIKATSKSQEGGSDPKA
ncbi:MAG: hypothetical protein DMF67_05175 [Acidobacteria bacterium]|nr:MAG: hypothetical protein DMF67_05175 [Acidobacteriota bacterium]